MVVLGPRALRGRAGEALGRAPLPLPLGPVAAEVEGRPRLGEELARPALPLRAPGLCGGRPKATSPALSSRRSRPASPWLSALSKSPPRTARCNVASAPLGEMLPLRYRTCRHCKVQSNLKSACWNQPLRIWPRNSSCTASRVASSTSRRTSRARASGASRDSKSVTCSAMLAKCSRTSPARRFCVVEIFSSSCRSASPARRFCVLKIFSSSFRRRSSTSLRTRPIAVAISLRATA
mmetsp:Transcript_92344/g.160409  ORF Transcript_92344/g.160409 Transcript_92344/m.160409 type:complete len:236 (-) Transcript_92344:2157-2864(-)